jgi:hypothetical protein
VIQEYLFRNDRAPASVLELGRNTYTRLRCTGALEIEFYRCRFRHRKSETPDGRVSVAWVALEHRAARRQSITAADGRFAIRACRVKDPGSSPGDRLRDRYTLILGEPRCTLGAWIAFVALQPWLALLPLRTWATFVAL